MARAVSTNRKLVFTVIGWSIGFMIFFPILWTFLTSFKTEGEAIASPPSFLFFHWTTENYAEVQSRSDYFKHVMNSVDHLLRLDAARARSSPSPPPGRWPSRRPSAPRTS